MAMLPQRSPMLLLGVLVLAFGLADIQTSSAASWCVPKNGVSEAQLQSNIDYACNQGIDCSPIHPGGVCYYPNTIASHAAYAMNLYFQNSQKNPSSCDFPQAGIFTGIVTTTNPSYNACKYPGRSP